MEAKSTLNTGRWRHTTTLLLLVLLTATSVMLFSLRCLKNDTSRPVMFSPAVEPRASDPLPGNSNSSSRKCAAAPLPKEAFFVIHNYDFSEAIGGVTVLHYLADRLNRLYGAITPVAFVTPRTVATNPGYMTPHLPAWRNASDGIAVYPEVESRNWMNANKVIRWVLWFPGGNGGAQALQYDPKDLIACYAPGICTEFTEQYTVKPLRLIDYGLEYLHDLPMAAQRQGNITYMGKTKWRRQGAGQAFQRTYPPMAPGEPLPRSMLKRERLEKFAKADMFISYDAGTWRSVEAALAGAKSVVIPVEGVTKEEWIQSIYGAEELQNGIAYGFEDLPHAIATQHLLLPTLKRRAVEQDRELRQFVADACIFWKMNCTYEAC